MLTWRETQTTVMGNALGLEPLRRGQRFPLLGWILGGVLERGIFTLATSRHSLETLSFPIPRAP